LATAEDVQVQVIDRLSAPVARIRGNPIAVLRQSLAGRNIARSQQKRASDSRIIVAKRTDGRDVFARHNQDVRRRCRLNVAESHDRFVFVDTIAGNLAHHDPAKDTLLVKAPHGLLPSKPTLSDSGSIMPELPEVETVRRTLAPFLRGRRITGFALGWHRTLEHPDLEAFIAAVTGATILDVARRGTLIVIRLDNGGTITVHLRMTGELLFRSGATLPRDPEREPYLRARFAFSDGSELLFYDTRKFGKIAYRTTSEFAELDAQIGLEPLEPTFTAERLAALLAGRRRQIKPLLLDQAVIAGLGNIYVDETLYRARIHPLQLSADVDLQRVIALHAAIVDVLTTAVALHGTTFRDYRSGLGEPGEHQSRLRVYGLKPGTPCPDCGTPLERLVIGQRGSIFCPNCQPLSGRR
jgi:formamidopyrimidine-DNA glycosylase